MESRLANLLNLLVLCCGKGISRRANLILWQPRTYRFMRLWHRLISTNPVLDYLNRRSWRRYRRWGWTLVAAPLIVVCGLFSLNALYLMFADGTPGRIPMLLGLGAGGAAVWALALVPLVFCMGGISRLLRTRNVEQLLLAEIEPVQIWAAVLVNLNRNLLILLSMTVPLLTALAVASTFPLWFIPAQALVLIVYINLLALFLIFLALQLGPSWFPFKALLFGGVFVFVQFALFLGILESGDNVSLAAGFVPGFFWLRAGAGAFFPP